MSEKPVKRASLPFKPYKINDQFDQLKMLVYSDQDVGRTVLAGSISKVPKIGDVLFCDVGANPTSLADFGYDGENLVPTKVESYADLDKILDYVEANPDAFGAVIIDCATKLQEFIVADCLDAANKKEPDLKVWNAVVAKMRNLFKRIGSLPVHVVVTALEKEVKDDDTGISTYAPNLVGRFSKEVMGYFGIMGRLFLYEKDESTFLRITHFGEGEHFIAKDKTGALKCDAGKFLVDASMQTIFELITVKHKLGEK